MKHKFATAIAIAAMASFGLVACGDDDEDEPATTAETTTEETTTEAGGGGGEASLTFTADPGGALAYEEKSAQTTAGSVDVELINESQVPHDVRFEDSSGEDIGGTDEVTGGTTSATVDFEPGKYTFYCAVPGHREAGMEGPLTVK